jgi:hypothetical protein
VRRNLDQFPEDFMFALTREEIVNLSQIVISSRIKHAPNVFVFAEQGVAMLSGVLNSERAIQMNKGHPMGSTIGFIHDRNKKNT